MEKNCVYMKKMFNNNQKSNFQKLKIRSKLLKC